MNSFFESFKTMINHYLNADLFSFHWHMLPYYIAKLMLYILLYRLICAIEMCIKNKKISFFDVIYILLILLNQKLILDTDGFELISWRLFVQIMVDVGLFIALHIMYKEKILCKKKDEEKVTNETEEKPHV